MVHEIRDCLMLKICILQRLKADRDKLKAQVKVLDIHLTRSYQGNIQEEIDFLSTAAKQKQQIKQIKALVREESRNTLEPERKSMELRLV
jgi:hypothetical protein